MELSRPVLSQLIRYGVVGLLTNLAGYLVYLFVTWMWLEPKVAGRIVLARWRIAPDGAWETMRQRI